MDSSLVYRALESEFRPDECTDVVDKIGLQLDFCRDIETVYTATFASGEVMDTLFNRNAHDCLLFTHHPSPQRKTPFDPPEKLSGDAVSRMERDRIALFSYHIPLDRNGEYSPGNNLARAMGLRVYDDRFYYQDKVYMGVLCETTCRTLDALQALLGRATGFPTKLYRYGDDSIANGRVAIMAGGASNPAIYEKLSGLGINAFITGVTNPSIQWVAPIHEEAKKHRVSIIGGTHLATEKFAPIAMTRFFEKLGLRSVFIDETPRLAEL